MTATATDSLTVSAPSKSDAPDVARRQWETGVFPMRVLRVLSVEDARGCIRVEGELPRWRVTAEVEVVKP